jgi:hypothetical protein
MDKELTLKNLRDAALTMRRDGYISTAADIDQAVFLLEDLLEKKFSGTLMDRGPIEKRVASPYEVDNVWLILKGGYFYRKNAQGYTSDLKEAAKFSYDEAAAHAQKCAELAIIPYAHLIHTKNDNYAARLYYSKAAMDDFAHLTAFVPWIELNDSAKKYWRRLADEDLRYRK